MDFRVFGQKRFRRDSNRMIDHVVSPGFPKTFPFPYFFQQGRASGDDYLFHGFRAGDLRILRVPNFSFLGRFGSSLRRIRKIESRFPRSFDEFGSQKLIGDVAHRFDQLLGVYRFYSRSKFFADRIERYGGGKHGKSNGGYWKTNAAAIERLLP